MTKKTYSILLVALLCLITLMGCANSDKGDIFTGSYEKDRESFTSTFIKQEPSIDEYENSTPPPYVSEVEYESDGLKLKAWVLNDPQDGYKYPAVVFMHGGFSFDEVDWYVAEDYINRGYVVMTPMVRGENGNPGNFEYFYGEVNDCIAAGKYLASLPYVDENNVFLMGHSAGGSLGVLASLRESPYKAIATNGASYGTKDYFKYRKDRIPFEYNENEIHIRSSYEYADNIKTPVYSFMGKDDIGTMKASEKFVNKVEKLSVPYEFIIIDGDHNDSLNEAIQLSSDIFDSYVYEE